MTKQVTKLRGFVASPGDVKVERERLGNVIEELNRGIAEEKGLVLELVRWETHAWPGIGEDAQDVINREIGPYDIFVGIMWKRFGKRTKRAGSGTEEEFNRAYSLWEKDGQPQIKFYFNRASFYPSSPEEVEQMGKVLAFKERLDAKGAFYWEYNGPDEFERKVREDLTQVILRWGKEAKGVKLPQPSIISDNIDFYLVKEGSMHYIPDNPTLRAVEKSLGLRIIKLSSEEMRQITFSRGDPLQSQAPQIFQDSRGMKYLVAREEKRRIPNDETLKALGGDPRSSVPTEDEYLASLREGLPLPEQLGEQWFTSKPKLEKYVVARYTSEFLVRGRICRYIPRPEWVEELRKGLSIGRIGRIDEQKLESYVEGISIESERDVQTVLLQKCTKGSSGTLVRD